MSAYKQLLSSDIIVSPLELNKSFGFLGTASWADNNVGIDRLVGKNITGSFSLAEPTTGILSTHYQRDVYAFIKQLYYTNYLESPFGSQPATSSIVPGSNREGDVLIGASTSAGRFDNFLQSTLTFPRFFPTASNAEIGVVSIPSKLYGTQIKPGSLQLSSGSYVIRDDAQGNLFDGNKIVGNVVYAHGIATIVDLAPLNISTFINSNLNISFSSSFNIYETQYKVTVNANEFNFTLNPTTISASNQVHDFVTGSNFTPYVTTVGLYNNNQELVMVAKLAKPLPINQVTDTNIIINLDR